MKISVNIDVGPKTAKDDPQIEKLLSTLPATTQSDNTILGGFVPFGDQAQEFTIGQGQNRLNIQADDQHISVYGSLDSVSQTTEIAQLRTLLNAIQKASQNYKGHVPIGQIKEVKNPFAG